MMLYNESCVYHRGHAYLCLCGIAAPNERFHVPMTAAQEVGWRVNEAKKWADAANKR